jgi:glycosyltransferase involved in cell wall biosynthesis
MPTLPISVVILTRDEEGSLPGCLASLAGCEDVHVLDSGSTDGTVELARRLGAKVHHHPFTGFGAQRNWAIDHLPRAHDWVLHLDADERLTPELAAEIARELGRDPPYGGYHVPHKLMFAGRWLKHAGGYPTYQVRLFHAGRLRFADHGHGQREQTAHPLGRLAQPYLHYAFSKGLDHWFAKHAAYARKDAEELLRGAAGGATASAAGLFSRDPVRRRRAWKRFSYYLPFRPALRFAHMLLVKGAFLDGRPGVVYAQMMATYEAMIAVHLRLLRHGLHP